MTGQCLVTDTGIPLSPCRYHLILKRCVIPMLDQLLLSGVVAKVVCVGSIAELEELSGVKITDLHRER